MKKLYLRIERCSGCKRCELACMDEHRDIDADKPRTRIFVESINERPVPVVCRHCKDALCVSACMAGCMQKDQNSGIVSNQGYLQKCVGCWMCIMACPYGVISPSDNGAMVDNASFAQALKCDLCPKKDTPACVSACPNEVIELRDIQE
ncbi:MAG: 4Fe-4S dicluster domain-containing protein [Candidatus Omnitrophota bacterium]|nr:4Fe-4S dicluster domain-containing protein [Candidatus Omnitrophota bacterium]